MHAAILSKWGDAPRYEEIPMPPDPSSEQSRVKPLAVAIHPIVRGRANGTHYTVRGTDPPHTIGCDGVGHATEDGGKTWKLAYFSTLNSPPGSGALAQYLNVDTRDVFPLPVGADGVTIAVWVNAAMSSWFALTLRAGYPELVLKAGLPKRRPFEVCILGSAGLSGRIAAHIARHLGAIKVISVARNREVLEGQVKEGLADDFIVLEGPIEDVSFAKAANVDVFLDYLWGPPTTQAMKSVLRERKDHSQRLTWVQIGSIAGPETPISAPGLRMSNMNIIGSGIGSWSQDELRGEMPNLLKYLAAYRGPRPRFTMRPMSEVEKAWGELPDRNRVVFTT